MFYSLVFAPRFLPRMGNACATVICFARCKEKAFGFTSLHLRNPRSCMLPTTSYGPSASTYSSCKLLSVVVNSKNTSDVLPAFSRPRHMALGVFGLR